MLKPAAAVLEGKVALVTGAGRGIGRAIALALAEHGALVAVNDPGVALDGSGTNEEPARATVAEIETRFGQGRAVASLESVADQASAGKIVAQAAERFGRIDIVVNNAGILRDVPFHEMSPEDFDAVQKVHLYGAFFVSRAAVDHFRGQRGGAFIHMTSGGGLIGALNRANYGSAKMGIVGLSRIIAMEGAAYGVRSNCIAPGAYSRMTEAIGSRSPEDLKSRQEKLRPEQVAQLAVFLASDAAQRVSGEIFGARGNELFLYSQPRPIRVIERAEGWTPESIAAEALPAWESAFLPLQRDTR